MKLFANLIHAVLLSTITLAAQAGIVTEQIEYNLGGETFSGYIAYDNAISGPRPGIVVIHEWWGLNDSAQYRARMLAAAGYTALAMDMYGKGRVATHPDDAKKFMGAVASNMTLAEERFDFAVSLLKKHPTVNKDDIAAMGYCFGGGMVLQMARAGKPLDGVVSFHGTLGTETPAQPGGVKAAVRAFNGADDPFVPAEQAAAFEAEMKNAGVDYELVNYPGVVHSFTAKEADTLGEKYGMPLKYDAHADQDSWTKTLAFFDGIFKK
ncbi:MAG: dienelactone hydrolase family protein [Gammaproteobacteria bacterium]|nr:dienelactone hydrolase family protein [Gammaproteobacteria bacterium]